MVGFTDRKEELKLLADRFAHLSKGELIILTGRRRVGKTELVRYFLETVPKEKRLYLFVDEGTPQDMLRSLADDVSAGWPYEKPVFSSWDDFFDYLSVKCTELGGLVVAIDEFQRLHADPRAFSRMQKAWDTKLKDKPIMLVLLGSAVSAIYKIAIGRRSPLFGRATARLSLEPFDYQAFREALEESKLDEELKIKLYATFGGIPRYLEFAEKAAGSAYLDLLEENMLRKNSILREEPSTILQMELKDTGRYNSILAAIAKGHRALNEISAQTGIRSSGLTFYLAKLTKALGLIEKRKPVCGKVSPQYVLKDNFFKFWYNFVNKNNSSLEIENYGLVRKRIESEIDAVTGVAFEDIVRELVAKHNNGKLLGMPVEVSELGGWWDRNGNEIDVCGQSKESLLLGEVRWRKEPIDYEYVRQFLEKRHLIQCTSAQSRNTTMFMVSKSGFTAQASKFMQERGVYAFNLEDITGAYDSLPEK